jgi:hypothetical protein
MAITERVQDWLEENGGAAACYLMPASGRFPLLFVSRTLGLDDDGLTDALAELEAELGQNGHDVRAYVLEGFDEAEMAEAVEGLDCLAIFRRPPRMAA